MITTPDHIAISVEKVSQRIPQPLNMLRMLIAVPKGSRKREGDAAAAFV